MRETGWRQCHRSPWPFVHPSQLKGWDGDFPTVCWTPGGGGGTGRGAGQRCTQGQWGRRGRLAGQALQKPPLEPAAAGLAQPPAPTSLPHVTQEGLPLPPHTPSPRLPPPSSVLCHPAREVRSSWASSVGQVTTQEEMDMGAELESWSDNRGEQGKRQDRAQGLPRVEGGPARGAAVLHRRLSGRGQGLCALGSRA